MLEDTICAISTTLGNGAISIVRVSGNNAIDIVNKIFFNASDRQILKEVDSHTINYGHIYSLKDHIIIDECLVSVMLAPRSFTGENTVEINCHGGVFVVRKVLEEV